MSKITPSVEIDKQLQDTFAAYVVAPVHSDVAAQLTDMQEKWLGKPERYDPETPYLETLMDDRLQRINGKLDKQQLETGKEFREFSTLLQDIRDNTDVTGEIADTADEISGTVQSVEKSVADLKEALSTLSKEVTQQNEATKAAMEEDTKTILNGISSSGEKNRKTASDTIDQLSQRLSEAAASLSQCGAKEREALHKQLESLAAEARELARKESMVRQTQLQTLEARLRELAQQACGDQRERLDAVATQLRELAQQAVQNGQAAASAADFSHQLSERYSSDRNKLRNILFLCLALNGTTVLGLIATVLVMLLRG